MIVLDTGAILDKEFSMADFTDGRVYHTRGWLSTFIPCKMCSNTKCRRSQYGPCDHEYLARWLEWRNQQGVLDNYGVRV